MTVTIWHNPQCSTSRRVLGMIRETGVEPEIVDYRHQGWDEASLHALLVAAGVTPRQALRAKDAEALIPGLSMADDATILAAMVAHPKLVERPFVRSPKGARLYRPAETVSALL